MTEKLTYNDLIYIIEECTKRISENVYADISKKDDKKKVIGLTYNKNSRNTNNYLQQDYLKTDKMDTDNADVYKVMLKGGIESYNITSIKGTEIMHYFKKLWDSESVFVKDSETQEEYKLEMLNNEQLDFLNQFAKKVGFVVNDCIKNFKLHDPNLEINGVSIYPVRSSSNFNKKMAGYLTQISVNGLPVQVIDEALFVKDLANLQKDEEFIKLNQDFYQGDFVVGKKEYGTVDQNLEKNIAKYKALKDAWENIPIINNYFKKIMASLNNLHAKGAGERAIMSLVNSYKGFYDTIRKTEGVKYYDNIDDSTKTIQNRKILVRKKYSKGPSIDKRTNEIWEIVKPYLRGQKCPYTGKGYTMEEICEYSNKSFEIKYLSNGERMGLKNYFSPNKNLELVEQELNKIKGTVFLIFDDNISGGATLGDICYQSKSLGIENIIPITFGVMGQSYQRRGLTLSTPKNRNNEKTFNFS